MKFPMFTRTRSGRYVPAAASLVLLLSALAVSGTAAEADEPKSLPVRLEVESAGIPPLPVDRKGAFIARLDGVLIVAGGAAAVGQDGWPTAAELSDEVHYLLPPKEEEGKSVYGEWQHAKLPVALAFGAAALAPGSMFCLGGIDVDGPSSRVLKIGYKKADDENGSGGIEVEELKSLPRSLVLPGACVMGGKLYVAGGLKQTSPAEASRELFSVEIPKPPAGAKKKNPLDRMRDGYLWVWHLFVNEEAEEGAAAQSPIEWQAEQIPSSTGIVAPVLGVRRDEKAIADALFIIGGWSVTDSGQAEAFFGGWKRIPEDPSRGEWNEKRAGWFDMPAFQGGMVAVSAVPVGPAHLLIQGSAIAGPLAWSDVTTRAAHGATMFRNLHVFTETWVEFPQIEGLTAAAAFPDKENFLLLGRPEEGTDASRTVRLSYRESRFSWLDYGMVVLYIGGLVWIGTYFSKREKGTEDFFLAGRKIPWWAAGLSIYATGVSAISFMAIPAKTYATNWLYICMGIFPIFSTYIAAYAFVPMLRRLSITSMTEYTQMRFNRVIRTITAVLMVFGQVGGRMSITLLLPSLALSAVTGWSVTWCILGMGVLATIYTVMGGIGAVIWTDVLQVFVLFGGAILSLILVMGGVEGGFMGTIEMGRAFGKFEAFDWSMDFTVATVWVMAIWGLGDIFGRLGQESMQRAFSTEGVKSARRSMLMCAIVSIPGTIIFYSMGSALFAYYRTNPQQLDPSLKTDAIFPLFIAQQLPAGISGLVIAGLFAAAMSTLDSGMNSTATVIVTDWFSKFNRNAGERTKLRTARIITIVAGALGTWMAWFWSKQSFGSLWDAFSIIMSLIGGGFGGIGALGFLTKRGNWKGALCGAFVNFFFLIWLKLFTKMHFFMYGTITMLTGFALGYLFSLLFGGQDRELTGLTLWTLKPKEEGAGD